MQRRFWKKNAALLFGLFFTFGAAILYGARLEVPVVMDEVVTLADGEYLLGNDWSYFIAATGSYYFKWFYGVLMTPILWLFRGDPHNAYRTIMILNGMLQASIMPVCYLICRRHLRVQSTWNASLLGICAAFVPSVFLYAFYARGDVFLSVAPWYVLLFLLESMRAGEKNEKGRRAVCTAAAALAAVIAFMAHTRGIVVGIALVLTALLMRLICKKSPVSWLALVVVLVVAFAVDWELSGSFKEALYWVEGAQANTLENMSLGRYFNVLSLNMLKDMLAVLAAWFYTLFSTTYGLVAVGVVVSAVACITAPSKRKERVDAETLGALFCLLVFVGYIAVGLLFFKGTFHALKSGELDRRVDRLLYDRYSYCGLSLMVFWAAYGITQRPRLWNRGVKWIAALGSVAALGLFFWKCYPLALRFPGYLYNTISLNTFSDIGDPWEILWGGYYTPEMLLGSLALGGGGFLLILLCSGRLLPEQRTTLVLALIVLAQAALVQCNYWKIRKPTNDIVAASTAPAVDCIRSMEAVTAKYPYVLKYGGSGVKTQFYQAQLPELEMLASWELDSIGEDYLVICSPQDRASLEASVGAVCGLMDIDYKGAGYDAVYVHGAALRQALEQAGYSLVPMS